VRVGGFAFYIRCRSVVMAELWGFYTGLILAWDDWFQNVELEVDSKIAVDMINADNEPTSPNSQLIHSIIFLLQWPWRVRFLRCADWLANSAQLHILLSWVFIIFQRLFLIIWHLWVTTSRFIRM
jgi:hypothetical protein